MSKIFRGLILAGFPWSTVYRYANCAIWVYLGIYILNGGLVEGDIFMCGISPWFITGFVDGDGTFNYSVYKNDNRPGY